MIEETLLRRLETEFATEIFPDTFYSRDHTISASTLSYLLRAYVRLQKRSVPEDMIARLLVLPFADEHITRGKLDGRVRGSCDGLDTIYDAILDFVASKFGAILALPICQGELKCSVDVLGNAIWKPLCETLVTKHSVIFQAADPNRFHRSYCQSMAFLAKLEAQCCASEAMRQRFRAHESVLEFKDKWNLDVYFQLRATELARALERTFQVQRSEVQPDLSLSGAHLLFECSLALWRGLEACWRDDVFLSPLVASFSKLCAQLLQFYVNTWHAPLAAAVAQLQSSGKVDYSAVALDIVTCDEDLVCAGSDFHMLRNKVQTGMRRCRELLLADVSHV